MSAAAPGTLADCGRVYGFERAGDVTPAECAQMIGTMHALRGRPLDVAAVPPGRQRDRAVFIADLRWHFGERYVIIWDRGYRGVRAGDGAAVTCPSAALLFDELAGDCVTGGREMPPERDGNGPRHWCACCSHIPLTCMANGCTCCPCNASSRAPLLPSEVAALFRVDPRTVTKWADRGWLPCFRTPAGHRRFRPAEVLPLLAFPLGGGDGPR